MIFAGVGRMRIARPIIAATIVLVAAPHTAGAQDSTEPARDVQVAAALSEAANAQASHLEGGLAKALGVIDRTGAHPLPDWDGPDPVPAWRTLIVPDPTPPMRGSALGPGYRSGQLLAGRSDRFEQVFLSGKKASIALSSPGSAPLSLRVLDAERNPVCNAADERMACRWVPLFTQRYMIEVRNAGDKVADYFLVVD